MSGLIQNIGHVKACHDPRRDMCPHNTDAAFNCDCVSGRKVERKGFRVVRVTDVTAKMHKVGSRIVSEIHPNGMLVLREAGKRTRYTTTLGAVLTGLIWRDAMKKAREKKAARKARRSS